MAADLPPSKALVGPSQGTPGSAAAVPTQQEKDSKPPVATPHMIDNIEYDQGSGAITMGTMPFVEYTLVAYLSGDSALPEVRQPHAHQSITLSSNPQDVREAFING